MQEAEPVTVLMAEDAAMLREPVAEWLRSMGYTVIEAADGNATLEILDSQREIDILFTDVQMPGMSGDALANRLAVNRPRVPVILTSGNVTLDVITEGVAPRRFVRKPYDLEVIDFNIRDLTGKMPRDAEAV
jgi:CheY-like chemotaxis protein